MKPKDLINYLYGIRTPAKNTLETLEDLRQAVERLSDDLYDEETHFFYELIQNADDNQYSEKTEPHLIFCLKNLTIAGEIKTCLVIKNNEIGFSEDNIKSLCSIGRSTKVNRDGYIGEKGIGFKSVFSVTDRPYICSNGYKFSLPKSISVDGIELGYIVPIWEETLSFSDSGTVIVLPLKNSDRIIEKLENFPAENILFLNKLTSLTIEIDLPKQKFLCNISKQKTNITNVVKLLSFKRINGEESTKEELFLYKSCNFEKPKEIREEKRIAVHSRPITIAIPLNKIPNYEGDLFAYLPVLHGTGLPFIINADFILPSSRSSVKEDLPWNIWLRNEIPHFFAEILEEAMNSSLLTVDQKINVFSSIPVDTNYTFFAPILDSIHSELKQRKILLTFQSDILASPEECQHLGQDKRKILETLNWTPEYMGEKAREYRFLSTELSRFKDILAKLDVKDNQNSILPCFTEKLLLKIDNAQLLELYNYLLSEKKEIGDTPLIPVCSGHKKCFVSAENAAVFWSKNKEQFPRFPQKDVFFVLKKFYDYIHSLYEDKEKPDELKKKLSELLGIKKFSIPSYCTSLKSVLTADFAGKQEEFIKISHFLIENDVYPEYFVTNLGIVKANNEIKYIVVSEDFDLEYGWQKIWQNESERGYFAYLVGYSKEDQKKLIEAQKIDKYPLFLSKNCNYTNWKNDQNGYQRNPFAEEFEHAKNYCPYQKRKMTVECPCIPAALPISYYLHFLTYHLSRTSKTIREIDTDKKVGLGICFKGNIFSQQYSCNPDSQEFPSRYLKNLSQQPCIETNLGKKKPSDVWLKTPEIYAVLGNSVPYIAQDISQDLAQFLGIHTSLTLDDLFFILEQKSNENVDFSLNIVEVIYKKISSYYPDSLFPTCREDELRMKIRVFFQKHKSIYTPNTPQHWHAITECYWKESEIFGNEYQYLEKYYSDELHRFFCEKIGIKEEVSLETYLDYWLKIQRQEKRLSGETVKELYWMIFQYYRENEHSTKWESFRKGAKLLTEDGRFVDSDHFLINDNQALQEKFSDASELAWHVQIEDLSLSELKDFYQQFDIKCLSSIVECTPMIAQATQFDNVTAEYLKPACIAMIATWICEQKGRDDYKEALPRLWKLRDAVIHDIGEPIPVDYSLSIADENIVRKAETCAYWDTEANIIYANCDDDDDFRYQLSTCIANALLPKSEDQDFSGTIELYLPEQTTKRIDRVGWNIPDEFRDLVSKERRVQHRTEPVSLTESSDSLPQSAEETVKEKVLDAEAPATNNEKTFSVKQINYSDAFNNAIPFSDSENDSSVEDDDDHEPDEPTAEILKHRSAKRQERFTQQAVSSVTVSKTTQNDESCPLERFVSSEGLNRKSRNLLRKCWDNFAPETQLLICPPIDPQVRIFLEEEYHGKCQICGKTFKKKDGNPYFVTAYISKRDNGGESDTGNAVCLCADHFAQWQYATLNRNKDFSELVADAVKQGKTEIPLKLAGEGVSLRYTKRHFNDLKDLLIRDQSSDAPKKEADEHK